MRIIGIDFSTDPKKTGFALGQYDRAECRILDAQSGTTQEEDIDLLHRWLGNESRALLAIDAPLGWPSSLGPALVKHRAGQVLTADPSLLERGHDLCDRNQLFSRRTDKVVWSNTRQKPMDVGADRIARTAHAALHFLQTVARGPSGSIPLAWDWTGIDEVSAIEVYPAATLAAHGLPHSGYKGPTNPGKRDEIIGKLRERQILRFEMGSDIRQDSAIRNDDNILDAVVCVLAGVDFLAGLAIGPGEGDRDLANREGWIWAMKNPKCS